ncbi:MAG: hypothetical protein R3E12_01670 [Candidatus Eisenbacteria bacterium]
MRLENRWVILLATVVAGALSGSGPVRAEDEGEGGSERAVNLADIPEATRAAILEEAGDHPIVELDEYSTAEGLWYEAVWVVGDQEIEVLVDAKGNILARGSELADGEEDETRESDGDEDENDEEDVDRSRSSDGKSAPNSSPESGSAKGAGSN